MFDEKTRAYLYRISLGVMILLVSYGFISESELAQWAFLAAAILGIGGESLAVGNTSISPGEE